MTDSFTIRSLPSGVPGLDLLLGGGIPEYSFNMIAGTPGSGKTTLAHQLVFSRASTSCPAIYFCGLGESGLKMLRHQQLFSFFDSAKVNTCIHLISLSDELAEGDLEGALSRILHEVEQHSPGLVVIDSFRSILQVDQSEQRHELPRVLRFMRKLAMHMASWQATTFLIAEYNVVAPESDPVVAVADSVLVLSQSVQRNAMARKMQAVKVRGQAQVPGWHSFRISQVGIEVFPRATVAALTGSEASKGGSDDRLTVGIPGLDRMLGGGLPVGYSMLVVGPTGCGKTVLATQFLAAGAALGEPGVLAAFEKSPSQLLSGSMSSLMKDGKIGVIDSRSLGMSIDETLHELIVMIDKMKAKRVVIDSLSGFELALAPEFREEFRASLYRMIAVLTAKGMTVVMTSELEDRYTELRFSPFGSAFLTDAIVMQRYVQIAGEFKRVMSVVKVRASAHSTALHLFDIDDKGINIGEILSDYEAPLSDRLVKIVV